MKTSEIAELVAGELHGDGGIEITSAAAVANASVGQIAFVEGKEPPDNVHASCLIVSADLDAPGVPAVIKVRRPKLAFALVAAALHPPKQREPGVHPSAVISESAVLGAGVFVGAFVCVGDGSHIGDGTHLRAGSKVGDNVRIGRHCVLHPNVFIEDNSCLGDHVILHSGVIVGADGFGYVRDDVGEYVKFPQIGSVVIEDDVEIGANSCVDRGALGETRIGEGTKIDNLVQVGHNVNIGKRCVIAAQTGISGSVLIEDECVIGGQVGFGDHAVVRSGSVIGSQAGVLPGKIVRPGVWWGTPIRPLDEFKRQNAYLKGIERMSAELKSLRNEVERLSPRNNEK